MGPHIISSPDPKAHCGAFSIPMTRGAVIVHRELKRKKLITIEASHYIMFNLYMTINTLFPKVKVDQLKVEFHMEHALDETTLI